MASSTSASSSPSSSDDDNPPQAAAANIQPNRSRAPRSPLSQYVSTQLLIFPLNPNYPDEVTFIPSSARRAVKRQLVDDFRQPPAMVKVRKVQPTRPAVVRPPLAPLAVFPVASSDSGRTQKTPAAAAAATATTAASSSVKKCSRRSLQNRLGQLELLAQRAGQQKARLLTVNRRLRRLVMKRRPEKRHFGCQTEDQLYYEMY